MLPDPGEKYRHYKSSGGDDYTYEVIDIGKHTETGEILIIYKSLYDSLKELGDAQYRVRPYSLRTDILEWKGKMKQRFIKIA